MYDLLFLAFQTDSTRVATFLLAYESSNRTFPDIGVTEGHHNLSHHQNKKETLEKIAKIDLWYMQQFARFLERLEEAKDVDGRSILHNSMIVYGSGNGDGNRHNHNNLPFVLAGSGGGTPLAGPLPEGQGPADEQHLPQPARPDGRLGRAAPRRLHRADRGDLKPGCEAAFRPRTPWPASPECPTRLSPWPRP